jgi:hypothetical protein
MASDCISWRPQEDAAELVFAARKIGGPYGIIVNFWPSQGSDGRRFARMSSGELDLPKRIWTLLKSRTKNAKECVVNDCAQASREEAAVRLLCPGNQVLPRFQRS